MGASVQLQANWPLIDANKLQLIKNLAEPDDQEDNFFPDLLALFFARTPELLGQIARAIADKEAQKLERSAHALKGTAGNLGAIALMKLAENLELIGAQSKLNEAPECLAELERIYPLTKSELETNWL